VHGIGNGFSIDVVLPQQPFGRDVVKVEEGNLNGAALAVDVLQLCATREPDTG
jgi:hypothetical protein